MVASKNRGVPASSAARTPDPVDLDVVGVAVAAVGVVDGEDVGVLLAEDRGQALGGLVDGGLPERTRAASFSGVPIIPESW